MIKLRQTSIVAASLHLAGFGTSVASVIGSYKYMMIESQSVPMSAAFATGLAVAIFFCWEFAFNSKRIKRRAAAALIAIAAAGISGQTVFEYNHHLATVELQAKVDAEAAVSASKSSESTAILKQQLAELKTASDALRTQNDTDLKTIADLSASDKKGADWQANQIRKEVDKRNQQIAANGDKAAALSTQLTTANAIHDATPVVVPITPMMIVRAYLFEILTVLSLLFAAWIRLEAEEGELEQVKPLLAAITRAEAAIAELQQEQLHIIDIQNNLKLSIADAQQRMQHITDNCIADIQTAAKLAAEGLEEASVNLGKLANSTADEINTTAREAAIQIHRATEQASAQITRIASDCIGDIEHETAVGTQAAKALVEATNRAEDLQLAEKITRGREVIDNLDRRIELAVAADVCLTNNTTTAKIACGELIEAAESAQTETINLQKSLVIATNTVATANKLVADLATIRHDTRHEVVATRHEPATESATTPATVQTAAVSDEKPKLSEDDIILMLRNRQIKTDTGDNETGYITREIIMQLTGWGKDKSSRIRDTAYQCGALSRKSFGKSGWLYFYPATAGENETEMPLVAEMA